MNGSEIAIAELLSRVAAELMGLRDLAILAEDQICEIVMSDDVARPGGSAALQELDRLTQTIGCLATATERLSRACPPDAAIGREEIASSLKLVSLSHRLLMGQEIAGGGATEIELF